MLGSWLAAMWPSAVVAADAELRKLELLAVGVGRKSWKSVRVSDLSASWQAAVERMTPAVEALQLNAATIGASYGASALAAQGVYDAPAAFVDPRGFVGMAADGRSLQGLLYSPVAGVKQLIANGVDPHMAVRSGQAMLDRNMRTLVADTGRAATSVDIATRPHTGYVRMLNPPSCSRCAILAGKFYRWNKGFQRHPHCDCRHIPSTENVADNLTTDPYAYFHSLSGAEQDKLFGKASAQAIRAGGDIFQVVNAKRGVKPGGIVTTEGTSKRGYFGNTRGQRLTPDAIYAKGLSREETLRELERFGYVLPGGQNPLGVIRGSAEGFGALGRGGTRVGAREAVLRARAAGVRDPMVRATMTAAERRAFDARVNWDAVRAKGSTIPPEIAARVELEYRRELTPKMLKPVPREVIAVKEPARPAVDTAKLAGKAKADTLTYESTLHMTDVDLADMMAESADDPAVFDRIMEIMDERDANAVALTTKASDSFGVVPPKPLKLDPSPATNPAARKQRNLSLSEKASEEYQNYAMSQYSRALDDLNGVLLNAAGKAHARGAGGFDLSMNIFSGSAVTARKYASEELLRWWEENGRETLGSFRYKMYGWETDRKAAQTVRNLGYERGRAFRDRSQL